MPSIFYDKRCRCKEEKEAKKEEISITKKRKPSKRSEAFPYPKPEEIKFKSFQIKLDSPLSLRAKLILSRFQNKYLYYAIDDILDTFKASPTEREKLLALLYSPVLALHNNFSVNFFDIWIRQVSIEEISKPNRFLNPKSPSLTLSTSISIQFFYKTKAPVKKQKSLW